MCPGQQSIEVSEMMAVGTEGLFWRCHLGHKKTLPCWSCKRGAVAKFESTGWLIATGRCTNLPWMPDSHTPQEQFEKYLGSSQHSLSWALKDFRALSGGYLWERFLEATIPPVSCNFRIQTGCSHPYSCLVERNQMIGARSLVANGDLNYVACPAVAYPSLSSNPQ